MPPATIIFFLCFAIIAWFRFHLALALLFFLLPAYIIRFHLGPIPTTMLEIMLWIIFAVLLIHIIRPIGLIRLIVHSPLTLPISLFLLGATISVFSATDLRSALGEWKAFYVEPFLLFLVLTSTIRPISPIRPIGTTNTVLSALILSGLAVSLLAIYQHFTGWLVPPAFWANGNSYRVTAWYGFPNGVGLFLAPLVPLASYLLIINSRMFKERIRNHESGIMELFSLVVPLFMIPASLFAIVYAKSTGALIGLAAGLGMLLLFWKKTRWPAITIAIIGLISLISPIGPINSVRDELLLRDRSGQIRIAMWREAAQLLRDRPILGAGLASYDERIKPYHTPVNGENIEIFHHPHNLFLTIWVNTGLIGLIGFIGLIDCYIAAAIVSGATCTSRRRR